MKELLPAGQIVNTHGIRGEMRVLPWADGPEFLLDFKKVYVDGKEYKVESARVQKTCVLLKLAGVNSIEDATLLREKTVEIARKDAKLEKGTFFVADLVGLSVVDQNGNTIGKLTEVLSMPKNDVYIVNGEKEYLIPAVKEYVKDIRPKDGVMEVVLIEGMESDAN
ncbi:MAG: 16S rRNA processing protein RimM [Oscillospiraceae bacterium]|nr:16S rRNA processing protein RimM [Oscillospiraceae bacterium]